MDFGVCDWVRVNEGLARVIDLSRLNGLVVVDSSELRWQVWREGSGQQARQCVVSSVVN